MDQKMSQRLTKLQSWLFLWYDAPPLCLSVSMPSTNAPILKFVPKEVDIYGNKVPYKELCLHFNREQQQPKEKAW